MRVTDLLLTCALGIVLDDGRLGQADVCVCERERGTVMGVVIDSG